LPRKEFRFGANRWESAEEKTLLQRYTKQLDEEETQLDALRKKKQDTEAQQKLANAVLQNTIQESRWM